MMGNDWLKVFSLLIDRFSRRGSSGGGRTQISREELTTPLPTSLRVPSDLRDDQLAFDIVNWTPFYPQRFNPSSNVNATLSGIETKLSGLVSKSTILEDGEIRTECGVVHPWTAAAMVENMDKTMRVYEDGGTERIPELLATPAMSSIYQNILSQQNDSKFPLHIKGPIIRIT